MKNKLIYSALIFAMSLVIYSCEDFIEVELSGKSVTILAPANNTVSGSFNQLFKWEKLKGAESYQLQIVKPNFSAVAQFVLDTTTVSTQFSYTLMPGTYQWRLRALNNASSTEYQTYNITIDSTQDLAFSSVNLSSPTNNHYSRYLTNTFTWSGLPYTDSYVLQILPSASTIPVFTQPYSGLTGAYTFTMEGTYTWRVYAQNSTSTSGFNTYTITVDTTKPFVPEPVLPLYDTTSANPIVLKWNTSITADSCHLVISGAGDSLFAGAAYVDLTFARTGLSMTYDFATAMVGSKYFWKVQDIDKAGNKSKFFIPAKKIQRL